MSLEKIMKILTSSILMTSQLNGGSTSFESNQTKINTPYKFYKFFEKFEEKNPNFTWDSYSLEIIGLEEDYVNLFGDFLGFPFYLKPTNKNENNLFRYVGEKVVGEKSTLPFELYRKGSSKTSSIESDNVLTVYNVYNVYNKELMNEDKGIYKDSIIKSEKLFNSSDLVKISNSNLLQTYANHFKAKEKCNFPNLIVSANTQKHPLFEEKIPIIYALCKKY